MSETVTRSGDGDARARRPTGAGGTSAGPAEAVRWDRDRLQRRRATIAAAHQQGASGGEIVGAFAELTDEILLDLYRDAARPAQADGTSGVSLVALGGYGRRELSPYSDLDLMFLYEPAREEQARECSTKVLHALWDLGFQVGHSLRTIADCLSMGRADFTVRTALMEARRLAGDPSLFEKFTRTFHQQLTAKTVQEFLVQKLDERRREYGRFGITNFLLEPNVKKSRGGLRDIHLLKWTALARYGTAGLKELGEQGVLAPADAAALKDAQEFLWRIRNELHFHAGRAQDILTFDEQVRIAAAWAFPNSRHLLAVEQCMQLYYQHSTRIADVTSQFVAAAMLRSPWHRWTARFPARQVERFFEMTRDEITVPRALRNEFLESGERMLRLFQLAQIHGLSIAHELIQELTERLATVPESAFHGEPVSRVFLAILAAPGRLADTLFAMHRVRVLERLVPAFGRVRGLMQFNAYHKYTVDHHSLLAVAQAEDIGAGDGVLSQVYHEIKRKDLLHLAILLHDLGKGQAEDHSVVGERIAQETAARLGCGEHDTRLLMFLVRHHLLMSHTAFRRDSSDEKVVLKFARQVGTAEALKMLYVLTAADIAAVGPEVFTRWKETLLSELYLKTFSALTGEDRLDGRLQHEEVRRAVRSRLDGRLPEDWLRRHVDTWPERYLMSMGGDRIAVHLEWVWRLKEAAVLVDAQYDPLLKTTEYTVYTREELAPGIFSKIAGVLAAKGLQILDAQIATLPDGVVVDVFQVLDADWPDGPQPRRIQNVREGIVAVLEGRLTVETLLQGATRFGAGRQGVPLREPTIVQVDNETSDRYTIIDVFADDCQGLLYVMTRAMFDLGLSVHAARISTKLDQVVDVFYVTDQAGAKVEDQERCVTVSEVITTRLEEHLTGNRAGRPVVHRESVP